MAASSATNRELSGFGSHFASEAVPGALPIGQNSPQAPPLGLYAEQLSGTAFTCPRATNQRSWLYRIAPSVGSSASEPMPSRLQADFGGDAAITNPDPLRWRPPPLPPAKDSVTFVQGLVTMCGAGSPASKDGIAVHMYAFNAPMTDSALNNADGDFLIVPQLGALALTTEFGKLRVEPRQVCVIPRNVRFAVSPAAEVGEAGGGGAEPAGCRGYVLECFGSHFRLPDLGPIGANGLAEPRDFVHPHAWFEDRACHFTLWCKHLGQLFRSRRSHSVFDVVGWHGNYVPFKYDLDRFHPVNSVRVDHPDPSIFTVLTVPTNEPGVAAADFVVFPPRYACAEHTFRPPYFHRNCMSEFMGLIDGSYDAKKGGTGGFEPGGASLHGVGTPHGPDAASFAAATTADTSAPSRMDCGMAFMFETASVLRLTPHALDPRSGCVLDDNYAECWEGMPRLFSLSLAQGGGL